MRLIETHGDFSLTEIVERIGISSPSKFYRQFVAVVGMTPSDWDFSRKGGVMENGTLTDLSDGIKLG